MAGRAKQDPRPSDLELQVLSLLWQRGPLTVRDILEAIPDGKPRAYTTVLSILQVMEKKGLVTHRNRGAAHVYKPKATRRQTLRPIMRSLVSNAFGGSAAAAMMHLLQESEVSPDEMDEIRQLVEQSTQPGAGADKGGKRS